MMPFADVVYRGEESRIAISTRQQKGKGGEAAVVAEAYLRSEWLVPQKDIGSAGAQPLFSDREITDGTFQTAGNLDKELSADKRRRPTCIFSRIYDIYTMNQCGDISIPCDRQGVDIIVRHNDPKRRRAPGGEHLSGEAAFQSRRRCIDCFACFLIVNGNPAG